MPPIPPPEFRGLPDPLDEPEIFEGLLLRRVLAYGVDLVVLGIAGFILWLITGFLVLLTFGLLLPLQALVLALLPFAYHIALIAGPRSATLGMRLMGLRVHSALDGGAPNLAQVAVNVVTFYVSIALTGSLILLVALFNSRGRTLHDYLAGTIVLRQRRDAAY